MTHEWDIETAYYTAKVPIWMDEVRSAEEWKTEFRRPEAKEVVEAIGAWVYCFERSSDSNTITNVKAVLAAIQDVLEEHVGYAANAVMLAVAVPRSHIATSQDIDHGEWEDVCLEHGFEFIDYAREGANEFREETGFARLKEALEANEWESTAADGEEDEADLDIHGLDDDEHSTGFARDEAEMTAELFGMKAALADHDHDAEPDDFMSLNEQAGQVDDLDRLMGRLLAVKEQSAGLPESERKRLAAKAVKELMRE